MFQKQSVLNLSGMKFPPVHCRRWSDKTMTSRRRDTTLWRTWQRYDALDNNALWDKTSSFWVIKNSLSHERGSERTSERCERTDERVAQYFSLYFWLFWPTVRCRGDKRQIEFSTMWSDSFRVRAWIYSKFKSVSSLFSFSIRSFVRQSEVGQRGRGDDRVGVRMGVRVEKYMMAGSKYYTVFRIFWLLRILNCV